MSSDPWEPWHTPPPKKWGVYCEAAPCGRPRYTANTKREAERLRKVAHAECQSKARHYVQRIEAGGPR